MKNTLDYVHLRAWCLMMGSYDYYVRCELEKARADGATPDVVYRTNGKWRRFSEVISPDTRRIIEQYVIDMTK